MTPTRTAIEILKAWFNGKTEDERFPVNCRAIAEGFGIKVHGDNIDSEFQGALFIEPEITAIIYNENIREAGRKNFTISHELGHFFLHKNRKELRCSMADLTDFGSPTHPKNIEQEANRFAVALLMPADDFRKSIRRHPVSVDLLSRLSEDRYQTSLTATAYRMVELSSQPLAIVIAKNGQIIRWRRNDRMAQSGFWIDKGRPLPNITLSTKSQLVDSEIWLDEQRASSWSLTQSAVHMPYYEQTLIMISAESREYEHDDGDDIPDTVDQIPKW